MSDHWKLAIVVGSAPPAMAVSWARPAVAADSGYVVSMSDDGADEGEFVCLHCLLDDGDEQLGRGLDLAKA